MAPWAANSKRAMASPGSGLDDKSNVPRELELLPARTEKLMRAGLRPGNSRDIPSPGPPERLSANVPSAAVRLETATKGLEPRSHPTSAGDSKSSENHRT